MTLEALLFDVDGTLADTEDVHRRAFNLVFERHRLGWVWQPPQYRELLSVAGGKERLAWFIDTLPVSGAERVHLRRLVPALHAEKNRCYRHLVMSGSLRLRPGIERLMTEARDAGCRLAIATTTSAVNVEALLQATLGSAGRAMFSAIACGDEVRIKKPSPYVYHRPCDGWACGRIRPWHSRTRSTDFARPSAPGCGPSSRPPIGVGMRISRRPRWSCRTWASPTCRSGANQATSSRTHPG